MGVTYAPIASSVPEPSTWAMPLLGLMGLGFAWGYRARAKTSPSAA
jgi:MYXO-CTERM domain-containing protein